MPGQTHAELRAEFDLEARRIHIHSFGSRISRFQISQGTPKAGALTLRVSVFRPFLRMELNQSSEAFHTYSSFNSRAAIVKLLSYQEIGGKA